MDYFRSTRIQSPDAQLSRPGSVTRNALARASDGTSPEPCHSNGVICEPSALKTAGRKRVSPVFWRKSCDNLLQTSGRLASFWPPSSSTAERAKISKVTMGDAGLPERQKKNLSRAWRNTG